MGFRDVSEAMFLRHLKKATLVLVLLTPVGISGFDSSTYSAGKPQPTCTIQTTNEAEARELTLGSAVEREIGGSDLHSYLVPLRLGKYMRVVVMQKGIDVVVRLIGPDNKQIVAVDSPNGAYGPEAISLIADATGNYRIAVKSFDAGHRPGRYEIKLEELREPTADDGTVIAAQRMLSEAEQLSGIGTAESLNRAIEK